ncbi:Uncharacterised protein [Bordetella pertussis]|nr:Uncharacterised protein [Bordetella pertussis]
MKRWMPTMTRLDSQFRPLKRTGRSISQALAEGAQVRAATLARAASATRTKRGACMSGTSKWGRGPSDRRQTRSILRRHGPACPAAALRCAPAGVRAARPVRPRCRAGMPSRTPRRSAR